MMQTLDGLTQELQVLKQRTLRIENRVKELRCPGPTPLEMMTGGSAVLNREGSSGFVREASGISPSGDQRF
jgi:hypothetical protein